MQTTFDSTPSAWLPRRRQPVRPAQPLDFIVFFVGVPVVLGFVFSLTGVRLIHGMPYLSGLVYMLLHMLLAWWAVGAGTFLVHRGCRSFRPPELFLCVLGFVAALVPAALLYRMLGDFYSTLYPVFAQNRAMSVTPAWSPEYILHFVRYSLPAIVLFVLAVKSYRYITGVKWFGYPSLVRQPIAPQAVTQDVKASHDVAANLPLPAATAALVAGSRLPADARLIAVKADQHYLHLWSTAGTDMVRHRFRDLLEQLSHFEGMQTHRSWWVNSGYVRASRQQGRRFELDLDHGPSVPVSVAFRNGVRDELQRRGLGTEQA